MNRIVLTGLLLLGGLAGTARATVVMADGEKHDFSDADVAKARASAAQCWSTPGTRECRNYHLFVTNCGFALPTEFNDQAVRVGLLSGDGSGNILDWTEYTYNQLAQQCTVPPDHDRKKAALKQKIRKIVFDGNKKKDGREPSLSFNNGVVTVGIGLLNDGDHGDTWGTNDPIVFQYILQKL